MQDIYGDEYLMIKKSDYYKLLDEIDRLRKIEADDRKFLSEIVGKQTSAFTEVISGLLNSGKRTNR